VLTRLPGLTGEAMSYIGELGAGSRKDAMDTIERTLASGFHRDQEWLHILRALCFSAGPCSGETVAALSRVVAEHRHPLVRARATLAWSRQTGPDETEVAETFFERERGMWKGWAVMAIRDKTRRDAIYESWRSEGRSMARLIDSLSRNPSAWRNT
jgi:hypothetical protein